MLGGIGIVLALGAAALLCRTNKRTGTGAIAHAVAILILIWVGISLCGLLGMIRIYNLTQQRFGVRRKVRYFVRLVQLAAQGATFTRIRRLEAAIAANHIEGLSDGL